MLAAHGVKRRITLVTPHFIGALAAVVLLAEAWVASGNLAATKFDLTKQIKRARNLGLIAPMMEG